MKEFMANLKKNLERIIAVSCPQISLQNQPNIYFVTYRQYWLGIAKLIIPTYSSTVLYSDPY